MKHTAKNPKEIAWEWYDKSKLAFWFRHDTWRVELGLCLICDIDPVRSEELDIDDLIDFVNFKPGDRFAHRLFKKVCLLSEDPLYKLEPVKKPGRGDFVTARKYLDEMAEWLGEEVIKPEYTDICNRLKLREAACKKRSECWELFESNPKHLNQESFAPSYFIDWAASKGIDISWLEWATTRDFVTNPPKKPPLAKTKEESGAIKSEQVSELREAAVIEAVHCIHSGINRKYVTVEKICTELLRTGEFSNGDPFTSRWTTIDGMRTHLKGKNKPTSNKRYLDAKPTKSGKFND